MEESAWSSDCSHLRPLRCTAGRAAGSLDVAPLRANGARRENLRSRLCRRQRAALSARESPRGASDHAEKTPRERGRHRRRRRRDWQRAPGAVRRRAEETPPGRRRRHLRFGDVRTWAAVDSFIAARPRLLRDQCAGPHGRSALRQLRRCDRQSGHGPCTDSRDFPRREWSNCHPWFLRQGARVGSENPGADALSGEKGYTTLEKLWIRPTCEVNGMLSGYTGEGAKTVLPAKAMAKVSCRLVPDQDPADIEKLMKAHLAKVAPKGVNVTVQHLHGGRPWRAELNGPIYEAARAALRAAFGKEPVITGEGGSIPVVGDFERILGAPVLLVGFGLPGA